MHLIILSNLETKNADLIENNIPQKDRLIILNETAKKQVELLQNNNSIEELEEMQESINKRLN